MTNNIFMENLLKCLHSHRHIHTQTSTHTNKNSHKAKYCNHIYKHTNILGLILIHSVKTLLQFSVAAAALVKNQTN